MKWTPSNSAEVIVFYNALPTSNDSQAGSLIISDAAFTPVAYVSSTKISAIYVGSTEVTKAYVGSTEL